MASGGGGHTGVNGALGGLPYNMPFNLLYKLPHNLPYNLPHRFPMAGKTARHRLGQGGRRCPARRPRSACARPTRSCRRSKTSSVPAGAGAAPTHGNSTTPGRLPRLHPRPPLPLLRHRQGRQSRKPAATPRKPPSGRSRHFPRLRPGPAFRVRARSPPPRRQPPPVPTMTRPAALGDDLVSVAFPGRTGDMVGRHKPSLIIERRVKKPALESGWSRTRVGSCPRTYRIRCSGSYCAGSRSS